MCPTHKEELYCNCSLLHADLFFWTEQIARCKEWTAFCTCGFHMPSFNKFVSELNPDLSSFCLSRPSFHQIWFLSQNIFSRMWENTVFSRSANATWLTASHTVHGLLINILICTKSELKALHASVRTLLPLTSKSFVYELFRPWSCVSSLDSRTD